MNLKQAVALAAEKLAALKDIDAPTFESEVLMRHYLKLERGAFHLKLKQELTPQQASDFLGLVERRLRGEPTAYIMGRREFFGLDFQVDRRVLIPRPETEMLVEESLKLAGSGKIRSLADIGTGSGAIAVSLAVNLKSSLQSKSPSDMKKGPSNSNPGIRIYACDISSEALDVARINARKHGMEDRIIFRQGNLVESLPQKVDLVIANLPYVSSSETDAMPSARYEPRLALDGGKAGLDPIFRLAGQLKDKLNPGGIALLEIGFGQSVAVTDHLRSVFPKAHLEIKPDLAGIERVVEVRYTLDV